jgi:cell division protein FtsI/penicillin-binding protein 2
MIGRTFKLATMKTKCLGGFFRKKYTCPRQLIDKAMERSSNSYSSNIKRYLQKEPLTRWCTEEGFVLKSKWSSDGEEFRKSSALANI